MRISEQWLREWVNPAVDAQQLAEQLTMAGLEVDQIETAADFSGVVVGKVTALTPHPEAQKLRVASVDVGQQEPLNIVCGAPNVTVGMHTPTALVGAQLPDQRIAAATLRGVASQGMLCSARELGLGDDTSGILVLPDDSQPGQDLKQLLALDDHIIDIDLTPNRGDCLSIVGIAREVGVINGTALTPATLEPVTARIDTTFPVTLSQPADCPRFVGRVIKGIDPSATSPLWMVEKLRRAGIRSIGPVVDITNYVMLEIGHPMHAYDLGKLSGAIDVRCSRAGETLELLNGQTIDLDDDTLLITDASGPIGLAGIMGGAATEVDESTHDVFFECAFFAPVNIAGKARRYGLHTEASHRFERGVNPLGQSLAVEQATRLLLDIAGGQPGPLVDTVVEEQLPKPTPITLRAERVEAFLGMTVPADRISDILKRLEMTVNETAEGWQVTAPSFRFDITMEADLIEEIGRIYGYQHLPDERSLSRLLTAQIPEAELTVASLRQALVQRGYQETITYSFVDTDLQQRLMPNAPGLPLQNPISSEMAVMRTSLWPGLLKALSYNQKRQQSRIRLFEYGVNFLGDFQQLQQEPYLGGIILGPALPEQWGVERRVTDFFDLKSDVEAVLNLTGCPEDFSFVAAMHPALHPGQCARIERHRETLGWLGALHPALARELDIDGQPYLFELQLTRLKAARVPGFAALSKFPASRRDLALLVDESLTAQQLLDSLYDLGGERLRTATLFDVYRGKGIPQGQKSLTFSLILQDFSRNLTDQDVDRLLASMLSGLQQRHGATLRA